MKSALRQVRYFLRGMRNFWKMRELIYNYVNWDHSSALKMLLFYLEDFQDHILACTWHSTHNYSQIENNVRNLRTLIDDDYCKEEWKQHDKRWGKSRHRCKKIKGQDLYELVVSRPKAKTPSQKATERKETLALYDLEKVRRKKALKQLRKLMSKDIFTYWC